jgi:hypothetical protein
LFSLEIRVFERRVRRAKENAEEAEVGAADVVEVVGDLEGWERSSPGGVGGGLGVDEWREEEGEEEASHE